MKFFTDKDTKELNDKLDAIREQIADLKAERKSLSKINELSAERNALKSEITDLRIEKSKITEDHAREERELRHMVGLEKKRQEQELALGKQEAILQVREENLEADKERFEEQMDFMTKRMEKEVGYLKDIMGQILDRLPTVSVDKNITSSEKVKANV